MMRPCNYNEAWGLLVSSKNTPKEKPDHNYNVKTNVVIPKTTVSPSLTAQSLDNNENIEKCNECLLYVITSPYCMSKLKELSNIFSQNNSEKHNSNKVEYPYENNYIQQFKNETSKFIEKTLESIYLKNNKMNEILLYAIIGIILGYLISQYMSRK